MARSARSPLPPAPLLPLLLLLLLAPRPCGAEPSFPAPLPFKTCGSSHPASGAHTVRPAVVTQQYESPELAAAARRLQTPNQQYEDSNATTGPYIPIRMAHALGQTEPMRITVVWDVVLSGDLTGTVNAPRQCSAIAQGIEAKTAAGTWATWSGGSQDPNFPGTVPCDAASVVSTNALGQTRLSAIQSRTQAAINYWSQTVQVKPVLDSIVLGSALMTDFGMAGTYSNTDLVMIMTARPSPASPIAGFAICYQHDQRGRCTVGQFNWVPNLINVATPNDDTVVESELHTALHELVHILGGMGPGAEVALTPFISDVTGLQVSSGIYSSVVDPTYNNPTKFVTYITTPRVVNFTRAYYGCPNATGFPLEDLPLGKGVHWEARVAGPELMSYGSGSGQVFISDLTLAFLEDTNQYIADYSRAGPIVNSSLDANDFNTLNALDFLQATSSIGEIGYVPPPPPPPGLQRYGAGLGCGFLYEAASVSFPDNYVCKQQQTYGCTPDNRMSAVCMISPQYTLPSGDTYCGQYIQDASGSGSQCVTNPTAGIASFEQFFSSNAAAMAATGGLASATAANTGGYNNAMDYVPVPVGFWNCLYANPASSNSSAGGDGASNIVSSISSIFGSSGDMATFGGQARCPSCRCMQSSLMQVTNGQVSTHFPSYGLCYRMNCYRPDYLQVAIKGAIPEITTSYSFWYACPSGGGKLYIPGYLGSLTCPDAVTFCANEVISGILYPEQNQALSAVFWGAVTLCCVLAFLVCSCPCLRNPLILIFKGCCGARTFEVPLQKDRHGNRPEPLPLKVCPSRTLKCINGIAMLAGLGIAGGCGYIIYTGSAGTLFSLLCLGLLIFFIGVIGYNAGSKVAEHGASCWLLTYFLGTVLLVLLMAWSISYTFAFTSWQSTVDAEYDKITRVIPLSTFCSNCTRTQGIAALDTLVTKNVDGVAGAILVVALLLLASLVAAGAMIEVRTLIAMFVTFVNHILCVFGVMLLIVGSYLTFNPAVKAVPDLYIMPMVTGIFFASLAILGHSGMRMRSPKLLWGYAVLQMLLGGLALATAVLCFTSQKRVQASLSQLSNSQLGSVASSLGSSLTGPQIIGAVQDSLNQLGLAFSLLFALQLVLFCCTFLLVRYLVEWDSGGFDAALAAAVAAAGAGLSADAPGAPVAKPKVIGERKALPVGGAGSEAPAGPIVLKSRSRVPAGAASASLTLRSQADSVSKARAFAAENAIIDI